MTVPTIVQNILTHVEVALKIVWTKDFNGHIIQPYQL